ncbi:putative selenate reductase subunit YgfK [candidate division KSB3 bacterium]|uniref:Putative selenate reductase subunit YgfK n=1 Tax=candidate division KSB3 bacterium TaxID=2044937 RepID=A0A2G6EAK6_9BACT|nr:MAG: putative selenate reductase subunit YgfK [candidate division KSB3 bacterium]PIE30718.1 MAG: putative selenate reductase subunit YgfK [candidate division KSB3 bacterium]
MGDKMRVMTFGQTMNWLMSEYREQGSMFGIHNTHFFRKQREQRFSLLGEDCDTVLGPAAGPHTQMTQNLVAAYLVGGRFLELKTVQKLDALEFPKPCIDARDEAYNTEWSTELHLEEAFDEYLKAWIILHVLERLFDFSEAGRRSFMFNMSIGYDLKGIRTPKMDAFINGMIDASAHPLFQQYLKELDALLQTPDFLQGTEFEGRDLSDIPSQISPNIVNSVTLSTMHGCPPEDIEAICSYLLREKKLNTFVKLNPTLLGYARAREILDTLGFGYLRLSEESFSHDLQYQDAVPMLKRLVQEAGENGREFGIKLSNTLGSVNTLRMLPGDEMYMSGRALFPLTMNVAALLSEEFEGRLPISYSGGISQFNVKEVFDIGIKPITLATDLLKPGGYIRMKEMAQILEASETPLNGRIDVAKLKRSASEALHNEQYQKSWRGTDKAQIDRRLPLFDCYAAPCTLRCPIHQDVPEYIRLAAEGSYDKALELIYSKNPLPHITGYICDHQCMSKCTRLDYDGAVRIRDMKLLATNNGWDAYMQRYQKKIDRNGIKAAVIGAGPAGLATSYFLGLAGFDVTVFERAQSAGGVVTNVLPSFRLPAEAVQQDIDFIREHGVQFCFGVSEEFSIQALKDQGFRYIFIGIGAQLSGTIKLDGDNDNVRHALDFLRAFKSDPQSITLGQSVAIVGGGNTAMDSARAALRLPGVKCVMILYRRTKEEMPADLEEFENAVAEGVKFMPLVLPERFERSGTLICRKMALGEPDAGGRRRPVPTDDTIELPVDALITAIGEKVNVDLLQSSGLALGDDGWLAVNTDTLESSVPGVFVGGDTFRGPSTVVESLADARKAAESIIRKEFPGWKGFDAKDELKTQDKAARIPGIVARKAAVTADHPETIDAALGQLEARRCLECHVLCNKCVDVCPNRANVAIKTGNGRFQDAYQIVHLDSLCNECGNCGTFCPYNGDPYKDKITLFTRMDDFEQSANNGFIFDQGMTTGFLRLVQNVYGLRVDAQDQICIDAPEADAATLSGVQEVIQSVRKNYSYLIA